MGYTDAQGRPELVMHPDIVRGEAVPRFSGDRVGEATLDRLAGRQGGDTTADAGDTEVER